MEKLKPCPFCGGEAKSRFDMYSGDSLVNEWIVDCRNVTCEVEVQTIGHDTEGESIKAWNLRYGDA